VKPKSATSRAELPLATDLKAILEVFWQSRGCREVGCCSAVLQACRSV
jgi:hypothetical protein